MKDELKEALNNNKEILKWLTASDMLQLYKEKLSKEEIQALATTSAGFYNAHFERIIKRMIAEQLIFMSKHVESDGQLLWERGVIQGIDIVKKWFDTQVSISQTPLQDNQSSIMEEEQ